jgi:hypothetical protein
MKKAESEKGRLSRAADKATKNNAAYAADQYVTKGLRGLNLSPDQKDKQISSYCTKNCSIRT